MFKIKIPCYFCNEETIQHEKILGDCPIDLYEIREVIIYDKPLFINPYFEKSIEKGTRIILKSNESLLSKLMVNEIESIIDNQLNK
jgi:hypothetical protein